MKTWNVIVANAALLLSTVALAGQEPKIGHSVTFDQRLVVQGTERNESWAKVIQEIDSTGQSYLVKWTQGQREESAWIGKAGLMYIDDLTEFCGLFADSEFSQSFEKLNTPAGEFDTCRLDKPGFTIWYSDEVPFGMVKEVQKFDGGDSVEQTVSRFHW